MRQRACSLQHCHQKPRDPTQRELNNRISSDIRFAESYFLRMLSLRLDRMPSAELSASVRRSRLMMPVTGDAHGQLILG